MLASIHSTRKLTSEKRKVTEGRLAIGQASKNSPAWVMDICNAILVYH